MVILLYALRIYHFSPSKSEIRLTNIQLTSNPLIPFREIVAFRSKKNTEQTNSVRTDHCDSSLNYSRTR
jgi:hypothetical protein